MQQSLLTVGTRMHEDLRVGDEAEEDVEAVKRKIVDMVQQHHCDLVGTSAARAVGEGVGAHARCERLRARCVHGNHEPSTSRVIFFLVPQGRVCDTGAQGCVKSMIAPRQTVDRAQDSAGECERMGESESVRGNERERAEGDADVR